ncbi:MAG: DEAD/DEAH box helicase, partial [Candidatus Paceibacterota bacterium]
ALPIYGGENIISAETVKTIEVPGLRHELFPFQKIGVSFIEEKNGRALIADEMGLGKTIQALAWLQLHPELRPAIVVVPASLKLNWKREAEQWLPSPKVEVLSGTKPWKTYGEILVINYDVLSAWVVYLKGLQAKVLIMDEIHYAKSSATKRTKAVKQLAKGIHHVIGLSGTPIVNRPIEAYNALTIINSAAIPNFKTFTTRYCAAKHNGFGWDFTGASNTEELHKLLIHAFMIRRKKSDVLKDLPDKQTCFVPIELDNEEEYFRAEKDFINYMKSTYGSQAAIKASNAETLVQINILRQLAIQGKMAGVIDWIKDFIESGEKLVVFATHIKTIDKLMEAFPTGSVRFDGTVNQTNRNANVSKFQNDPDIKLFFGMLDTEGKPAGVGITLTAAWSTATVEHQWSPGVHDQADDRTHRIGQKNACTNYKLMAANTIDEKFAILIDKKRIIIDSVLDGKVTQQQSLLSELMKEYL